MRGTKVFRYNENESIELEGYTVSLEKKLQTTIETNIFTYLRVYFLATEYSTINGRIDTLGIDENNRPVVVEYKRTMDENVVMQVLSYLSWLDKHKAEFQLLVTDNYGIETGSKIDWSNPRLICIAGDYSKNELNGLEHINRNIELIRYCFYGDELITLELVNKDSTHAKYSSFLNDSKKSSSISTTPIPAELNQTLRERLNTLNGYLFELGENITLKTLKTGFSVQKGNKKFVEIEVKSSLNRIIAFVKGDPDNIQLNDGFTRDTRKQNYFGQIEITIRSDYDLEQAKPLLLRSYELSS